MPQDFNFSRRSFIRALASATALAAMPRAVRAQSTPLQRVAFSAPSRDGLRLVGEAQGKPGAPEVLFIHGLRQASLSWNLQFDDPALASFRMVRFDLRGHGDSDRPQQSSAYSDLRLWADDVAAVMTAAELRRPVLVGWSLGGTVIGSYLKRYGSGKLAGINLVNAVTKSTPEFLTPLSAEFARRTSSLRLAERSEATAEFLRASFERPPSGSELEALLAINGMTPREVTVGLGRARADLDPAFRTYRGPLLITHGERDRLLKVAMAHHNEQLHPGAQVSLYPDVGHSPFYEDATRFNRELAAFVLACN